MIDELARAVTLTGKVKGEVRRAMTPGLAIRFVLLMTLMPADYAEVMAALIGDLAGVPWHRPCALPTATVASAWREAIGPEPLEQLRLSNASTRATLAVACGPSGAAAGCGGREKGEAEQKLLDRALEDYPHL